MIDSYLPRGLDGAFQEAASGSKYWHCSMMLTLDDGVCEVDNYSAPY